MAKLLLELGAARGLRDHSGLTAGDIARQRNHWDLLTLLDGAGAAKARHQAPPDRGAGLFPRVRTTSNSVPPSGGGAPPRCRTLSADAGPRGGGARLQARTASADLASPEGGACSLGLSLSRGGAGGGPPPRGRRFSSGMRRSRLSPAVIRGRSGVLAASGGGTPTDHWPGDWGTLTACGPAPSAPIPPPCLTPSPERASPQLTCGPLAQVTPLKGGNRGQK